ncbi:MAG: aminoglycoside phosphotransferase [Chloroflexi bacterium]|nr:MAG: aminoglycoside phosphotransferase [Chloroflexota bacterium]
MGMKTVSARQRALYDDKLPAVAVLLGPQAHDVLAAALGPEGLTLLDAAPAQVHWRPGSAITVQYRTRVRRPDGTTFQPTLVAHSGGDLPAGATIVRNGNLAVAAWPAYADPCLPGLAHVLDTTRASALVRCLGAPDGALRSRILAYRPGRRAVVELQGETYRLYAKLVPPDRIGALQARHRIIAASLPAPRSHGWSQEHGLVLLEALPGDTLRSAFDNHAALPPVAAIVQLLEHIPDLGDGQRAPSPLEAAPRHARLLRRILPEHAARIRSIVERLAEPARDELLAPVHGDLYEAQIMVADGEISGLLDIDTVGLGQRVDDLATFLAHLVIWEPFAQRPRRVRAYARELLATADTGADPASVRRRVAAVVLGLATNSFRVQERNWPEETLRRVRLAEEWLASAERVEQQVRGQREDTLTGVSSSVHTAPPG